LRTLGRRTRIKAQALTKPKATMDTSSRGPRSGCQPTHAVMLGWFWWLQALCLCHAPPSGINTKGPELQEQCRGIQPFVFEAGLYPSPSWNQPCCLYCSLHIPVITLKPSALRDKATCAPSPLHSSQSPKCYQSQARVWEDGRRGHGHMLHLGLIVCVYLIFALSSDSP
jgi:hypothetical protein